MGVSVMGRKRVKIVVKILTNEEAYNLLPWIARAVLESSQTQRQDGNHSDVGGFS